MAVSGLCDTPHVPGTVPCGEVLERIEINVEDKGVEVSDRLQRRSG